MNPKFVSDVKSCIILWGPDQENVISLAAGIAGQGLSENLIVGRIATELPSHPNLTDSTVIEKAMLFFFHFIDGKAEARSNDTCRKYATKIGQRLDSDLRQAFPMRHEQPNFSLEPKSGKVQVSLTLSNITLAECYRLAVIVESACLYKEPVETLQMKKQSSGPAIDYTKGKDTNTCPKCGRSYPPDVVWCDNCKVSL